MKIVKYLVNNYKMDEIIKSIQLLIKNSIIQIWSPLSDVKKVYYGDPIIIPQSSMPAIAIHPISTNYMQRWSKYDEKTHNIVIKLIYNAKNYFNDNTNIEKIEAIQDSILKTEKTLNFETLDNTICGIIEKNPTLNNNCSLVKVDSINYNFNENRWTPTYEVNINIIAKIIWNR